MSSTFTSLVSGAIALGMTCWASVKLANFNFAAGLYITYPHDKRNAKKVGLSETLLEGALLK